MSYDFQKIAIANRGEVAVRIIRSCQELGIESVLLHSKADEKSLAYRLADQTFCIGDSPASESYLNIDANIHGALMTDVDALHPGFGFLSENSDFAEACRDKKLQFIGPSAKAIRLFGDKISAKNLVEQVGVPVIPGYQGADQSLPTLIKKCGEIGFPVIVKATAGGGGRGLRIIRSPEEAESSIESAQREGQSAFGSSKVFIEKYLDRAKHIEVQVFGAADGTVFHLGQRDCSVQRRHQKIIEEAGENILNETVRNQLCSAAIKIAKEANYFGAGTVEFLVQDSEFYFLEMNTRLQVEHPVTECVMGVDLVKSQIIAAEEKSLLWNQSDLVSRGHAIECRLYAEDPYNSGMPSTGLLGSSYWPQGPGRRFDIGFEAGDVITTFYDSMIAKVIVWNETRSRALEKMRRTLKDTVIFGVKTNIPYLLDILNHTSFVDNSMTTRFIDENYGQGISVKDLTERDKKLAHIVDRQLVDTPVAGSNSAAKNPWLNSWGGSR